jgi:Ca2+-binding RTX toxin-like protein
MLIRTALAALAALALAAPAHATFPGATGLVAFQSDRGGDYGIWVSNADASGPRVLYDGDGTDEFNPKWSPNGAQLAYQSGPPGGSSFDVELIAADGSGRRVLVGGPTSDRAPDWCDADTIVFTRDVDAANADIWAVEADGTGLRRLTDAPGRDSFPTCSPDGRSIAFISNRDGTPGIWEMGADGSSPRRLVAGFSLDPDYAADGSAIAYVAPDPADGNLEVFTRDLATGTVTQQTFTPPPIENRLPHYAPAPASAPAARAGLLAPLPSIFVTRRDPTKAKPELNVVVNADTIAATPACRDPFPAGPPAVPTPADPGGPGNNSAAAGQPAPACVTAGGTLTATGTPAADTIRLVVTGGATTLQSAAGTFSVGGTLRVTLLGGGGPDVLENATGIPVIADGGPGPDRLLGGAANDQLRGDAGNDELRGGAGNDVLDGGAGADTQNGGPGTDVVFRRGRDTVVGAEIGVTVKRKGGVVKSVSIVLTDADEHVEIDQEGETTKVTVFARGDQIVFTVPTPQRLDLHLAGGDDSVRNRTGIRMLAFGGEGKDHLVGGSADDELRGGPGRDTLEGGAGKDRLLGEGDDDVLRGDDGNDTLEGGSGDDSLAGGPDHDDLFGGSGSDGLQGDAGDDRLYGGLGDDRLRGGPGEDRFRGGPDSDIVFDLEDDDETPVGVEDIRRP